MPKITVISEEIRAIADRMGLNCEAISSSHELAMSVINGFGPGFSGTYPSVMLQYMLGIRRKFALLREKLEKYRDFLDKTADTYEWNDQQLAKWQEVGMDIPVVGPGGWDTSDGWGSVSDSFPNPRPDFSSKYYDGSDPTHVQRAFHKEGKAEHGPDVIDCCFYARSRAMEVNGWDKYERSISYASRTFDHDALKNGNCIVWFGSSSSDSHAVYVECYDEASNTIYFSESNMDSNNGRLISMPFENFLTYQGWRFRGAEA